jgi:hypothetical protein
VPLLSPQVFVTYPGAQFGASWANPSEGSAIDKTMLRIKIRMILLLVKLKAVRIRLEATEKPKE